jgi:hypothetical protein
MERETNRAAVCTQARATPSRDTRGVKTVTLRATLTAGGVSGTTVLHLDREAAESLYRQLGSIV